VGVAVAVRGPAHLRFTRRADDRVLLGVAGGLARRLQADPYVVRLSFVVLTLAGGLGVPLYLVAWALSDPPATNGAPARPERGLVVQRSIAVALVAGALAWVMREVGLWPGDGIVVPVVIVAAGSALLWFTGRAGTVDPIDRLVGGKVSPARAIAGTVLAVVGLLVLASSRGSLHALPGATAALGLAAAGFLIVLGPYLGQLASGLNEERRERIRSEERAAIAADLHDSVLQTLALMQRSADDPKRMVMLARRQERELRAWLYGPQAAGAPAAGTLLATCEEIAAQVEVDHELPVELVVVGDAPLDEGVGALVGAVREAATNAAKHAGAERVAIYVEVEPEAIVAFVRDTGDGFEPAEVPADRRGLCDSIVGRLARAGGSASLDTAPGNGTEWELRLPRGRT
jgi:signal transduction histidine kinase/phage shock protein PspC (stress-responsive transcriptional regulator)